MHWKRGRKSARQAVGDSAKSTATSASVGAITAGVLAVVPLGPLAVPVAVGGTMLWAGNSIVRLASAAKHDLMLDELRVFFCKDKDCRLEYAQAMVDASQLQNSLEEEADE